MSNMKKKPLAWWSEGYEDPPTSFCIVYLIVTACAIVWHYTL